MAQANSIHIMAVAKEIPMGQVVGEETEGYAPPALLVVSLQGVTCRSDTEAGYVLAEGSQPPYQGALRREPVNWDEGRGERSEK